MHQLGYVHGDMKDNNILLTRDYVAKVADFGMSGKPGRFYRHGTPMYSPPESLYFPTEEKSGFELDVWGLGIMFLKVCGGFNPISHKKFLWDFSHGISRRYPMSMNDIEDLDLYDLITGMLCINPNNRFTLDEVLDHPWMRGNICK